MFEIRIIFLAAAAMAWFVQPVSATPDDVSTQAAGTGVIEVGTAVRKSALIQDLLPNSASD